MKSKYVMTASSLVTGVLGIAATFFPKELLINFEPSVTDTLILLVQIMGALYFGFAVMNWMAKTILIGGIYARPLAMGNFAHFLIAAIALLKVAIHSPVSNYIWILTIIYLIFSIMFAIIIYTTPVKKAIA